MKIEYLFTVSRQGKIASKIIAYSTSKLHPELEPCSHVAVKIGPLIVESTLTTGVHIQPYQEWIKNNRVIYAFIDSIDRKAVDILTNTFSKIWGKSYDYKGILFFSWRMLGFLILKRPLPKINRWENKDKRFCVELISTITGKKYSMISPIQLVSKWINEGLEQVDINKYEL